MAENLQYDSWLERRHDYEERCAADWVGECDYECEEEEECDV